MFFCHLTSWLAFSTGWVVGLKCREVDSGNGNKDTKVILNPLHISMRTAESQLNSCISRRLEVASAHKVLSLVVWKDTIHVITL